MEKAEIVKLSPNEWQKYKKIRLEALSLEPQAFGTTYDEAVVKPDEYWKNKLSNTTANIYLFVRYQGQIVGTVGTYFEEHEATIVGLYVRENCRGLGLGKKLVQGIIKEIQGRGIGKVKLEVRAEQKAARALYENLGFSYLNKSKRESKENEIQELIMEKSL